MSIVTAKELLDGVTLHHFQDYSTRVSMTGISTEEQASSALEKLRDYTISSGESGCKGMRPWYIIPDYFNRLDESQSWMGFEWETDWLNHEARAEAIRWAWDNTMGCSFDLEGSSTYATELTMPPQEVSVFEAEEAEFQKLVKGLSKLDDRGLGAAIISGTHLNFSTPLMREIGTTYVNQVVTFLNYSLANLTPEQRAELFGRSPTYGAAYNYGNYVECKLFRSTYSYEQFQRYVKRSIAMVKLAEQLEAMYKAGTFVPNEKEQWHGHIIYISADYCSNLFEVLEHGAEPIIAKVGGTPNEHECPNGNNQFACNPAGEDDAYWAGSGEDLNEEGDYWDDDDDDDYWGDDSCDCGCCDDGEDY